MHASKDALNVGSRGLAVDVASDLCEGEGECSFELTNPKNPDVTPIRRGL
jgi:hypothetical protein